MPKDMFCPDCKTFPEEYYQQRKLVGIDFYKIIYMCGNCGGKNVLPFYNYLKRKAINGEL